MDTVGDAYIIAGLLDDSQGAFETRKVCRGLLAVAETMIEVNPQFTFLL